MKALNRKLLRDIDSLRIQIFSMAVLIACGVSVLVASWSSYVSLQQAQENYYRQFAFADLFAETVRSPLSLLHRIQDIQDVQTAEGRLVEDALVDLPHQAEPALGRLISYSPQSTLNKIYLRQGRLPLPAANEVLVHESFAKAHHLQAGDSFRISIQGQQRKVIVVGVGISPEFVYALSPLSMFPDDLHFGIIWTPHVDLARWTNQEDAYNSFLVKVRDPSALSSVKAAMNLLLDSSGSLGAYDRSQQISHLFIEDEIRQQRSMSYVIPAIFISVAAFILYSMIARLIGLQRTQIAGLKSLGYHSSTLTFYYWKLVTFIALLGLLPALVMASGIGKWYAHLYERYFRFPHIDFSLAPEAVLIGAAAGLLPVWFATSFALMRVFKLNPAEAMLPPAPRPFHKSLFAKLLEPRNLQNRLILRNIFSRPLRAFFSILGLAAAVGILINGSFWSDIIDYVIQRQFHESSREDLEIRFHHPRRIDIFNEIARIPGVYMIEGARTLPVRLHYQNIKKETAILSTEGVTSLRLLLDRNDKIIAPKENHILLSQYFTKKYGIQKGDRVSLEVTDKTHPDFTATVGGFVDDVVGASIYANKSDLHRWLSEMPSINTLYIKIDPSKSEQIYLFLKKSPEVLAVNIKKLLLQSFTVTLSSMIWTFTLILVLFAITISSAVLFNLGRINLSEKSWELASMRIMGFEVPEVFRILFLEIGIQILVALAPGLMLGYFLSYLSTKWIHTDTFNFPLVVDIQSYALAVLIIVILFFVTGYILYRKVRDLNLTEALKARE